MIHYQHVLYTELSPFSLLPALFSRQHKGPGRPSPSKRAGAPQGESGREKLSQENNAVCVAVGWPRARLPAHAPRGAATPWSGRLTCQAETGLQCHQQHWAKPPTQYR